MKETDEYDSELDLDARPEFLYHPYDPFSQDLPQAQSDLVEALNKVSKLLKEENNDIQNDSLEMEPNREHLDMIQMRRQQVNSSHLLQS